MDVVTHVEPAALEGILSGQVNPGNLDLQLLRDITGNFSDDRIIGKGGCGEVYKGILPNGFVAVKKLLTCHTIDDKMFLRELDTMSEVRHPNIICFLGYCSVTKENRLKVDGNRIMAEVRERLFCFEYVSNGSLDNYLTDELRGLEWHTRYQIIQGICNGLLYLHKEKHILHMDLKPANILLGEKMVPKITDFGLATLDGKTQATTAAQHMYSPGYAAPEYVEHRIKSQKADIYSLGVIIIEVVTGSVKMPNTTKVLRRWRHRWNKSSKHSPTHLWYHQVKKCLELAVRCMKINRTNRPHIWEIIDELSEMDSWDDNQIKAATESSLHKVIICGLDDMLGIDPLEFRFPLAHKKQISCSIELTNDTDDYLAFRITTIGTLRFCIQPDKGIAAPRSKCRSTITLPTKEMSCLKDSWRENIIVQSTKVGGGLTTMDVTLDMFDECDNSQKNTAEVHKVVDEVTVFFNMQLLRDEHHQETAKASSEPNLRAKMGSIGASSQVNLPVHMLPVTYPQSHSYQQDDFHKTVARTLSQGSSPMSMDFHPFQQTLLLVGTNVGDIGLWDVGTKDRLVLRNLKFWDLPIYLMPLQDAAVSVNRIIWNPDGTLFGVAYSRYIVQIFSYHGGNDIRQHLEIDAHVGGVNDIAFTHQNKHLRIITCGDDKKIKVWEATSGARLYTLEGHEAPVYSVCPHCKENIQFIFSTSLDGKIKAWLYDNLGSRVDYDAPGHWCTTMAYSADGSRLFSCGTSKDGESHLVEWNESEGAVKRTYQGFRKRFMGVVQFDTTRNRFLAAGDEFMVKIWDMDNTGLLTTIDAEGGLPACPRIRFNKEGTLLAVSTLDSGIKILANADGLRLLRTLENRSFDASRNSSEAVTKPLMNPLTTAANAVAASSSRTAAPSAITAMNGDSRSLVDVKPRIADESLNKSKVWKLTEITESTQCRSIKLADNMRTSKISRLIYTNSGLAILALTASAVHLLWKWPRSDQNSNRKATASVAPTLWQPPSGIFMTNDMTDNNPEEAVHCFALSKYDSYVMSASGGKISLFNMMTFETMTTFMPPPPAATFLAFHPQDNSIFAIGMDDSTIQIYSVRIDEVKSKLRGHSKRITGLAFSNVLNVLVSSGADAQLCVWNTDGWEKQKNRFLQIPLGRPSNILDTSIQFHQDQMHFLVVHETQIVIFETTKLEPVKQWPVPENSPPITHATFSCDSQLIYASFMDATVGIFNASSLRLQCRILPASFLPPSISPNVHPVVVAAHPSEASQFALGLTDGGVYVLEPLESERKWGNPPPAENGSTSNLSTPPPNGASSSDQIER